MPAPVTQEFRREPVAVPQARLFVRQTLDEWGVTERADDMQTCVSELATNAVRHDDTRGRSFLVTLSGSNGLVRIEVHDASRRRPRLQSPDSGSITGRGLLLVDQLADGWGGRAARPSRQNRMDRVQDRDAAESGEPMLTTPRSQPSEAPSAVLIASLAVWHWIDETPAGLVAFLLFAHPSPARDDELAEVSSAMRKVAASLTLAECSAPLPDIGPRLYLHGTGVFLRLDECEYLLRVPMGESWANFARAGGTVAVAVGLDPLPGPFSAGRSGGVHGHQRTRGAAVHGQDPHARAGPSRYRKDGRAVVTRDLRPWLGALAAPRIARLPPPAETDDGNHWITGRCWLWCGRERTRVLWIGTGTAPGGVTAHLFACASCAQALGDQVLDSQLSGQRRARIRRIRIRRCGVP